MTAGQSHKTPPQVWKKFVPTACLDLKFNTFALLISFIKTWEENREKSPLLYKDGGKLSPVERKAQIHSPTTVIAAMLATLTDFND